MRETGVVVGEWENEGGGGAGQSSNATQIYLSQVIVLSRKASGHSTASSIFQEYPWGLPQSIPHTLVGNHLL